MPRKVPRPMTANRLDPAFSALLTEGAAMAFLLTLTDECVLC
jgi:hypothetical protein